MSGETPSFQRVALTGSSGLVGTALKRALIERGDQIVDLVRRRPKDTLTEAQWTPEAGLLDPESLGTVTAVIHLAGENIASGRWTAAQKRRIRDSRVIGTEALSRSLASLPTKPRVLISASAVGYYGDRGEETVTEASGPGRGFLPEVCVAWEMAAQPAREAGIRVVHPRFGMILSRDGGALAKMLTPFRLGLGGPIGSGRQMMSWIAIDDVVGTILHALDHNDLSGPVNTTTPHPVTNAEFSKTLGAVLHRPAVLPLPAFAARVIFGQMADELLLSGVAAMPMELLRTGYHFRYPELREALQGILQT